MFAVDGAGCDEDVNPVPLRTFYGVVDLLDIGGVAARQAADNRPEIAVGDRFD